LSEVRIPLDLLPIPTSLFEFTWALIGWLLADSFSKRLDEDILNQIDELKKTHPKIAAFRWVIENILHFLHHTWIGLLLMLYLPRASELFWLGYGLFIQDAQFHLRSKYRKLKQQ
jgi:hypothetical protein